MHIFGQPFNPSPSFKRGKKWTPHLWFTTDIKVMSTILNTSLHNLGTEEAVLKKGPEASHKSPPKMSSSGMSDRNVLNERTISPKSLENYVANRTEKIFPSNLSLAEGVQFFVLGVWHYMSRSESWSSIGILWGQSMIAPKVIDNKWLTGPTVLRTIWVRLVMSSRELWFATSATMIGTLSNAFSARKHFIACYYTHWNDSGTGCSFERQGQSSAVAQPTSMQVLKENKWW